MHPTHANDETELDAGSESRVRRRLAFILGLVLVLLLLTFIPPLINVSRFQRRIDRNISASLGRPVHFNGVTLNLVPLPGFTLENFVVEEDPAFGSEPILSASEVRVTLRIGSLWRRRIEFSRISLTEPSVNLVHLANGKWNVQSLLLQASHIEAAPTQQRYVSAAPRFPYIEATGARLNLKLDREKTPFSLTDADFALWLPEPRQWHLRIKAQPVRTDTSPGDTGLLRVEGTLGAANSLAQIPIELRGNWEKAQLGGLSRLLTGRDIGLRGGFSVDFSVAGAIGRNIISTDVTLTKARRAEFVPATPLSIEVGCRSVAGDTFHSFTSIECHWPPADSSDPPVAIVVGDVPDIRRPDAASAKLTVPGLSASALLEVLSVASRHPPTGLTGPGVLSGYIAWNPAGPAPPESAPKLRGGKNIGSDRPTTEPVWKGELDFSGELLELPAFGPRPVALGELLVRSTPPTDAAPARSRGARAEVARSDPASGFDLLPLALPLGGKQPAMLEGHFDGSGYTLHLSGNAVPARLLALGDAFPEFGDGLKELLDPALDPAADPAPAPANAESASAGARRDDPAARNDSSTPVRIDVTASRAWGGPQVWRETTPPLLHK